MDVVIPLKQERRKGHPRHGQFFFTFPANLHGMQGNGSRFYLKTKDRGTAEDRLNAVVIMTQLSNPTIGEF